MDPNLHWSQRTHSTLSAGDLSRSCDRRFGHLLLQQLPLIRYYQTSASELNLAYCAMNVAVMVRTKGKQFFALIASLATGLAGCASSHSGDNQPGIDQTIPGATKWGHYDGEPVTKWNPDGRTMTLLTELRYTDPKGEVWVAPIGSVVDGASIPRYLWSFMGGPFEGKYRNASVLHDVAYGEHKRPWQDCDRMFYYAMRCSGVGGTEAKTMYYALYKFGH